MKGPGKMGQRNRRQRMQRQRSSANFKAALRGQESEVTVRFVTPDEARRMVREGR